MQGECVGVAVVEARDEIPRLDGVGEGEVRGATTAYSGGDNRGKGG